MLTLTGADLEGLLEHCRRELPNEACGILGGRAGRVESVHPVESAHPSPTRFVMAPAGLFRALELVGRSGRQVVGIYHSHPAAAAVPSGVDLRDACWPGTALANYPGAIHVIVSLQNRNAPVVKGYALSAGAFVEVPIVPVAGAWEPGRTQSAAG